MERLKKLVFQVFASLVSILVTFIVLEIAAQVALNCFAGERTFRKYASLRQLQKRYAQVGQCWSPHRYLGHYATPYYQKGLNRHNSLGYRGDEIQMPKPAGRQRIVCTGGSTTYTTEVEDYHLSYPALLEQELRSRGYDVDVVNDGVGSWTSWESLVSFEFRTQYLEPDIIILYHGVNDVLQRMVWPPEAYRGDNSGTHTPILMPMPSILEYSTLMRYFMIRAGVIKSHSSMDRHVTAPAKTFYLDEFVRQKRAGTYPEGFFREVSARKMFETNKPVYFRRNIENNIELAKSRNVKTVLATFAYSSDFPYFPTASSEEFISAHAEMNETLKEIARQTGASLFDFALVFPKDKCYFTDGIHVNAEGSALKAKLFADYLIETGLVKK
ncbi:MAG TPA: SGNH/GDSL hydrolase family protein [Anaerohalosphaeraceae bacterium]|nr:SGNH/GDSL hydrolase family protein [Anaerohalosphaeraceae bacterium]